MKFKILLLFSLTLICSTSYSAQRVRRIDVHGDQIVTVRTSIGIATIIQVPDRPNSVVVGDQDSFKVEYLDQAITIKPVLSGAKSNLYVYTDWKRYNVELISGAEVSADYVVYLQTPKEKQPSQNGNTSISWTNFKNTLRNENLVLEIKRLGRAREGILLVEFVIKSNSKEKFNPEWIWLSQAGETKPIHNLYLSSLEVSTNNPISGVLQLKRSDLATNEPMRIEMRRKKMSYLTLTKVDSWK